MRYYIVLVTGGKDYFLTPCIIIKARGDEDAWIQLKEHNKSLNRYRVVLDRLLPEDMGEYLDQGVHIAENAEDISHAF